MVSWIPAFAGMTNKDTNVLVTALRRVISLSAPEW